MTAWLQRPWCFPLCVALGFVVLWAPALFTPFWGDDYVFLMEARAAREAGLPLLYAFWPDTTYKFWRPLSQETYWRLIEQFLDGHAVAAHAVTLLWHLLSCWAVATLAHTLAVLMAWRRPMWLAVLAAGVYGLHGLHLLPVHWVAATNSAMLITWMTLGWSLWLRLSHSPGQPVMGSTHALATVAGVLVLQALALCSKESAILWPVLALVLGWFVAPGRLPGRWQWVAWGLCVGLCLVWWVLRQRFTAQVEANYVLTMGSNVLVNATAMLAWLMNVPREAIRLLMAGDVALGALWCAMVLLPMGGAMALVAQGAWASMGGHRLAACVVFAAVACSPYLLLAQQSYEYYAALAWVLPSMVFAVGAWSSSAPVSACILFFLASLVSVKGSEWVGQPTLLARAHWAEADLVRLSKGPVQAPVWVEVRDRQQFYAVGTAGLAWRFKLPANQVHVTAQCENEVGHGLRQDAKGHLVWQSCGGRER